MTARRGRGERAEGIVQVVILLAIGSMAAAASFTHVHNVAVKHGQPGWLAWADAVVLELMSIATGLEIRRRHRARQPTGFVLAVLISAVVLSLAAQVVEAERSVIGWLAAALPALGFLALVKMILTRTPAATVLAPAPTVLASAPAVPTAVPTPAGVQPVPKIVDSGQDQDHGQGRDRPGSVHGVHNVLDTTQDDRDRQDDRPDGRGEGQDALVVGPIPAGLATLAHDAARAHLAEHGRVITRDQLRAVLRVSTDTATVLHRQIRQGSQDRPQDGRDRDQDRHSRGEDHPSGDQDRPDGRQRRQDGTRPGLVPVPVGAITRPTVVRSAVPGVPEAGR